MSVAITPGTGANSVAAEAVGGFQFQQVEIVGPGGASVLSISPSGALSTTFSGSPSISGAVTIVGTPSISGAVTIVGTPSISGAVTIVGSPSISGAVFVSGSVLAQQTGTVITSIVSSIPSSVLVGASIFGQLPAGTAVLGSVATLQGTTPWINTNVGSIITLQVGSVITTQIGSVISVSTGSVITVWQSPSIVGTYVEDAASASGDKGVFVMGVRNDTLASVTSADGDYSGTTVGPMGEVVVANAPITKWISGTASTVSGGAAIASVALIAAQGSSVFTNVTSLQIYNSGASSALITFTTGGSILGYGQAPTGGGANIVMPNGWRSRPNFTIDMSASAASSVISVSAQGFISKT